MIKTAVVGAGYWGPNVIRNLREVDGLVMAYCVELRQERRDFVQRRFPDVQVCAALSDIVDEVDAVIIATPPTTHYSLALAALQRGKHVLVDKPVVLNNLHAKHLSNEAAKNNLVLMGGHTFLYGGAIACIKKHLLAGDLGDLYYFESTRVNLGIMRNDVSVIWDLAPHDISILEFLFNLKIQSVYAVGLNARGTVHDTCYITLTLNGGAIALINIGWRSPVKYRRMVICGSKRMIVYDDMDAIEKVKIYSAGIDLADDPQTLTERQLTYRTGEIFIPRLDTTENLQRQLEAFRDAIVSHTQPLSGPSHIQRVTGIMSLIEIALQRGMPVCL